MRALVIVGHGSHLNEDSSLPVYEHAARIRKTGEFDEVVECFWKEEPSMRHVLDTVESDEVYVVPAFISEGYFTQQVVPRELGLDGAVTEKAGRTIRYAGPLGTFEGMPGVILERAHDLMRGRSILGRTALVLLGHGTDLNKNSANVIYLNAQRIRERGVYDAVEVGFLDQEPEVGHVVEAVEAENVIVIPLFIAEGWHTRETIPEDLGLTGAVTPRGGGKMIFYGAPVGTHPSMAGLIAARARETDKEVRLA